MPELLLAAGRSCEGIPARAQVSPRLCRHCLETLSSLRKQSHCWHGLRNRTYFAVIFNSVGGAEPRGPALRPPPRPKRDRKWHCLLGAGSRSGWNLAGMLSLPAMKQWLCRFPARCPMPGSPRACPHCLLVMGSRMGPLAKLESTSQPPKQLSLQSLAPCSGHCPEINCEENWFY